MLKFVLSFVFVCISRFRLNCVVMFCVLLYV